MWAGAAGHNGHVLVVDCGDEQEADRAFLLELKSQRRGARSGPAVTVAYSAYCQCVDARARKKAPRDETVAGCNTLKDVGGKASKRGGQSVTEGKMQLVLRKTAGVLYAVTNCGITVGLTELFISESRSRVYAFLLRIMDYCREQGLPFPSTIVYDDACHLRQFIINR